MSDTKDKKPTQTFNLVECDEDDVICFGKEDTCKISKLRKAVLTDDYNLCRSIIGHLSSEGIPIDRDVKTDKDYLNLVLGIDCSILKGSGGGWKKGKLKMKLILETWDVEEKPEKSESPLDDIRRSLSLDDPRYFLSTPPE